MPKLQSATVTEINNINESRTMADENSPSNSIIANQVILSKPADIPVSVGLIGLYGPGIALIGIILTFIGVLLTIRWNWKKTLLEISEAAGRASLERDYSREQSALDREHNSNESHKERLSSARKDVYLELVGEFPAAMSRLISLPLKNIGEIDSQAGLGALISASSKIGIVGDTPTIIKGRSLLATINSALPKALVIAIPMRALQESAVDYEQKFKLQQAKFDLLRPIVDEYNAKNIYTEIAIAERESLLSAANQAAKYASLAAEQRAKFSASYREYTVKMLTEAKIINLKMDELVSAIRSELGVEPSLEELRTTSLAMEQVARESIDAMYADLEKVLSEDLGG